jgi:hypothetical protein
MAHIEPITVSVEIATHDQHELRAVDEALRAEASAELFGALTRSGKIRYLGDQIRVRDRELRLVRAELERVRATFTPPVKNPKPVKKIDPGALLDSQWITGVIDLGSGPAQQMSVDDCIAEVERGS